jgi:hypothetical protein
MDFWDVANRTRPVLLGIGGPLTDHLEAVTPVALSTDGRTLATGS